MHFSAPGFLWLLLLLPPALLLGLLTERFAGRVRKVFAAPVSRRQPWRGVGRIVLACLAIACLALAMAGPRVQALVSGDVRHATVLAVGLDVSKSMLAEDVPREKAARHAPAYANRLDVAGRFASQLFEELDGESAGLFFFARNGIEVVPPTRDRGFLRYMVQHTQLADLTESGSNLAAALDTGAGMLADVQQGRTRAIVLVSDGEDTENSLADLIKDARKLIGMQIPVFTVGVGGSAEVFIPIRRPGMSGIQGFYTDSRGSYLRTRRVPRTLREIAAATGGTYFELGSENPDKIAARLLQQIANSVTVATDRFPHRATLDISPLFLLTGLLFYTIFLFL